MAQLPKPYLSFRKQHPEVAAAHEALGAACAEAGPLDPKTRELVRLGISIGGRLEGAVHSHARQALEEGISAKEIRQVCNLAITTLGFPAAMAALSWVNDMIANQMNEGEPR